MFGTMKYSHQQHSTIAAAVAAASETTSSRWLSYELRSALPVGVFLVRSLINHYSPKALRKSIQLTGTNTVVVAVVATPHDAEISIKSAQIKINS